MADSMKAPRSFVVKQVFLTWLVLTCVGLAASWIGSCSLIVPVALATLVVVFGPFLPHLRYGDPSFEGPRTVPIARFLRGGGSALDPTDAQWLSMRIDVSVALVPGLCLAAALALVLPVSPFLHGMWASGALLLVLLGWPVLALAVRLVARAKPIPSAVRAGWPRVTLVLSAILAPVVLFSIALCVLRPDPDWYWSSLTPIYMFKNSDPNDVPLKDRRRSFPKDACMTRPHAAGYGLCWYPVDEEHCVPINELTDICLACVGNYAPAHFCPGIDVRRDERNGQMQVGRTEVTNGLLRGSTTANALDIDHIQYDKHVTAEGDILTARAVRHSVSVPLAWVAIATAGLGLAVFLLERERRRLAELQRAQPAVGPYRVPAPEQRPVDDTLDRLSAESLIWRYAVFVLFASSAPMLVALALGVGR